MVDGVTPLVGHSRRVVVAGGCSSSNLQERICLASRRFVWPVSRRRAWGRSALSQSVLDRVSTMLQTLETRKTDQSQLDPKPPRRRSFEPACFGSDARPSRPSPKSPFGSARRGTTSGPRLEATDVRRLELSQPTRRRNGSGGAGRSGCLVPPPSAPSATRTRTRPEARNGSWVESPPLKFTESFRIPMSLD